MGVIRQDSLRDAIVGWRGRSLEETGPLAAVALGLVLGVISVGLYVSHGYSHTMLWLWLAGLVLAGIGFAVRSRTWPRVALLDVGLAGGVAAACSPLYLALLYRWPVQVSSDEVALMDTSQKYAVLHGVDPLGVSFYLTRPALLFIAWGRLGNAIGGVDLFHMRLLHAIVGLITIAATYALFRLLMPRSWAFLGAFLVGVSHSMFMISRLALRENTAVLVIVVALALLLWGVREDHELATYLGGVVAGLGFYVYFPARIVFPIWVVFLIALALFYRRQFRPKRLAVLGAIAASALAIIAAPLLYSESQVPPAERSGLSDGLLIFKAAREQQKNWVFASSEWSGYKTNVKYGLGTFNDRTVDHGWIYVNEGHGFLDPLTGILLWVGVGVVGIGLLRRRRDESSLLMLGGFFVLWLSFAFAVNKAPNYTRLLVTLPFVAYLVVEALRWLAGRWRPVRFAPHVIVGGFLAAIVVWNLAIGWDFIQQGRRDGDPIGTTGRYVTTHQNIPGERFYMVSSDAAPYYIWGDTSASYERLTLFARDPSQVSPPIDPVALSTWHADPPFALFMRRTVWQGIQAPLVQAYPQGRIRNLTPDGQRVVLEVPAS